jgi:hypothetical protein
VQTAIRRIVFTFAALAGRLAEQGFTRGAPRHIRPETLRTDQSAVNRCRCPLCKRPGLDFHPYQNQARYKVVAACPRCGGAVEV